MNDDRTGPQSRQDLWAIIRRIGRGGTTVCSRPSTSRRPTVSPSNWWFSITARSSPRDEPTTQDAPGPRCSSHVLNTAERNVAKNHPRYLIATRERRRHVVEFTVDAGSGGGADALRRIDAANITLSGLTIRERVSRRISLTDTRPRIPLRPTTMSPPRANHEGVIMTKSVRPASDQSELMRWTISDVITMASETCSRWYVSPRRWCSGHSAHHVRLTLCYVFGARSRYRRVFVNYLIPGILVRPCFLVRWAPRLDSPRTCTAGLIERFTGAAMARMATGGRTVSDLVRNVGSCS